jgi:hypothetical protein
MSEVFYVIQSGSHNYLVRHNDRDHFVANNEVANVQIFGCTSDRELIAEIEAQGFLLSEGRAKRLTKMPQSGHDVIGAQICYRRGDKKYEGIPVGFLKVDNAIDISPPPK